MRGARRVARRHGPEALAAERRIGVPAASHRPWLALGVPAAAALLPLLAECARPARRLPADGAWTVGDWADRLSALGRPLFGDGGEAAQQPAADAGQRSAAGAMIDTVTELSDDPTIAEGATKVAEAPDFSGDSAGSEAGNDADTKEKLQESQQEANNLMEEEEEAKAATTATTATAKEEPVPAPTAPESGPIAATAPDSGPTAATAQARLDEDRQIIINSCGVEEGRNLSAPEVIAFLRACTKAVQRTENATRQIKRQVIKDNIKYKNESDKQLAAAEKANQTDLTGLADKDKQDVVKFVRAELQQAAALMANMTPVTVSGGAIASLPAATAKQTLAPLAAVLVAPAEDPPTEAAAAAKEAAAGVKTP